MNIKAEKETIIRQFEQIEDEHLIRAIKNMLDYALKREQQINEVPEWHKTIVQDRLEDYKKNPDSASDFDAALDDVEKEL